MQDPRLRLFTLVVLSLASFFSVAGALGAFIWWLAATPRTKALPRPRVLLPLFAMIALTALVSALGGGDGLSYLLRMSVILLLGAWAYAGTEEGEVLSVAVWALGNRKGFDIGLIAEMGLAGLGVIREEIEQVAVAMRLKGIRPGLRSIVPLAIILIITEIRRTDDVARLLTVRGYTAGGVICPRFQRGSNDILASISAVLLGILPTLFLRDVFILL
ncbi:MAG TPA: energy-coupling factor transporter transmembrane component T [Methanoculleus sp.]|nr:energy-coupling factor transporter transmembrane component T [Methanoculleus sp.]